MGKQALLLTLGHNSSAILVMEGQIVCGYENERLTKKKADSSFPQNAIIEIMKHHTLSQNLTIYVSHWVLDFDFKATKWWSQSFIDVWFPNAKIISLDKNFTHHDAHAWSITPVHGRIPEGGHTIVCDGFGNLGETLSIYNETNGVPTLIYRSFGFESSLGLFYQYATSFIGLKENQDEYKLLGYEAHIKNTDLDNDQIRKLNEQIEKRIVTVYSLITLRTILSKYDPMYMKDALMKFKLSVRRVLEHLLIRLGIKNVATSMDVRVIIAYFVQSIVEGVMLKLLKHFNITKLYVAGGVFMNVKLNKCLAEQCTRFEVMPLAGDQGCALGLYEKHNHDQLTITDLYFGTRDISLTDELKHAGVLCYDLGCTPELSKTISDLLNQGMIINIIHGSMEFGSRALCHTSTLALPTVDNVDYINLINGRSTIMPMAPVIRNIDLQKFFMPLNVVRSLEYMICTLDYKPEIDIDSFEMITGAAHVDVATSRYTGRPQLIYRPENTLMYEILSQVENNILINTSFNIHGVPIVFNEEDILKCHLYQKNKDADNKILTIIIRS